MIPLIMKKMNHILSKKFVIYEKKDLFLILILAVKVYVPSIIRDYCHYTGKNKGAAHNNCNLNYKESKEIPIVFHNGSTNDYHFNIKELAKKFDGQFRSLGENTEKYIIFSVPF